MRSSLKMHSIWLLALSACVLSACQGDLPKASEIAHMRVLGARSEVQGDTTRSTPKPGETVVMSWATAYPSLDHDDSELSSLFITCTAPERFIGIPICQEFLDLAANPDEAAASMLGALTEQDFGCEADANASITLDTIGVTCSVGSPKLTAKIESGSKLDKQLVRGIVCQNGTPFLDPTNAALFSCKRKSGVKASDAESIPVYGTIPIQQEAAAANANPSIADASFKLRDSAWDDVDLATLPASDEDCNDAVTMKLLPQSDGRKDELTISFQAKSREKFDGELETIEFSAYATAGELGRRFTVFDPMSKVVGGQLSNTLTWEMSKADRDDIGAQGKLVRFYFSVLDHRGGFDITSRAVCVLP